MTQTMTRSKVQNIPMPDLEQTAAQSPGAVSADLEQTEAQLSGFCVADLEPASLREKESKKAPPTQARRQRGTKPGQQRRPHSAERPIGTMGLQPACNAREKVTSIREGKQRATMTRPVKETRTRRERHEDR